MNAGRGVAGEQYSADYAREHGRFAVIPAAYILLRRGDEVLLQLRRDTGYHDGYWACGAAGHVEQGESVFEAAVRESAEELGVRIDAQRLEALTVMHRTSPGGAIEERVDFFFQCREWVGQPSAMESKAADLGWFPLDALPHPVVPHELIVLDGLRDGTLAAVTPYGF